jgi:hypothetical protein
MQHKKQAKKRRERKKGEDHRKISNTATNRKITNTASEEIKVETPALAIRNANRHSPAHRHQNHKHGNKETRHRQI